MRWTNFHAGVNLNTGLWVAFWLYILQAGDPSLLIAIIEWIGRH